MRGISSVQSVFGILGSREANGPCGSFLVILYIGTNAQLVVRTESGSSQMSLPMKAMLSIVKFRGRGT